MTTPSEEDLFAIMAATAPLHSPAPGFKRAFEAIFGDGRVIYAKPVNGNLPNLSVGYLDGDDPFNSCVHPRGHEFQVLDTNVRHTHCVHCGQKGD